MRSESRGRAGVIAPSALGSKDHPAGPSEVPLRRICQAIDIAVVEDPSAECGEGSVASSRHDNLPRSPAIVSRNEVWKVEGVSTILVGVLVPGTWYPHHTPILVVMELELHQNSKAMEPGTKGNNASSRHINFQWRFA